MSYLAIWVLRPLLPWEGGLTRLFCLALTGVAVYLAAMLLLAPGHISTLTQSIRNLKKGEKE
jgi:hypothetical protein